jgi:hypothetical protein
MPAWPNGKNPDSNINVNQDPTYGKAATSNTAGELFKLWKDYKKGAPDKARMRLSRASRISKVKGLGAKN